MTDFEFLNRYEEKLEEALLGVAVSSGMLDSMMVLTSDDISDMWNQLAPEYIADAVREIAQYPTVSLAWASYLGAAIAYGWDSAWQTCQITPYKAYHGANGFDDMDEHIIQDILGLELESQDAQDLEMVFRRLGEMAHGMIRREQIESQSPMAFHVFARSCKVMFRIGAAIELRRLGYRMEPMVPTAKF